MSIEQLNCDVLASQKDKEIATLRAELAAGRELRSLENEVSHEQLREISDLKAELAAEQKARKAYADEWPRLVQERDSLRAELAAERVLCESYLLDKNQITQAWADELDRVKELQAELVAERDKRRADELLDDERLGAALARAQKAEDNVTKLHEALERIADTDLDGGTAWLHEVANAVLKETGGSGE